MKSAERNLLVLLAAVAALAISAVNAYLASEARGLAADSLRRLDSELKKDRLGDGERRALEAEIESLKTGAGDSGEKAEADPVALGSAAKHEFSRRGITVKSYAVTQGKRASAIEFELEGEASGFASLLEAEGGGELPFSISRCSFSKSDRPGRIKAGIGLSSQRSYLKGYGGKGNIAAFLAGVAGAPAVLKSVAKAAPTPSAAPAPRVDRPAWLSFIGMTVASDGTELYFLKDSQKGRMLELRAGESGDAVISQTADSITIRYSGVIYEVRKK